MPRQEATSERSHPKKAFTRESNVVPASLTQKQNTTNRLSTGDAGVEENDRGAVSVGENPKKNPLHIPSPSF